MAVELWLTSQQANNQNCPQLWLVESGAIAVFVVPWTGEGREGTRRFLFRVTAGEALFPILINQDIHSYGILAVSLTETHLNPIPIEQLQKSHLNDLIIKWHEHLNSIFPAIDINLTDKIADLHDNFCESLTDLLQQENHEKIAQFQRRQSLENQISAQALTELISIIEPETRKVAVTGDAFLIAAGRVGKAMGISILPPAQLDNSQDPLVAIARASRIRIRRVQLEAQWWKQDLGPILGYTAADNLPVALIPIAPGKYEIFQPQTNTYTPVNQQTAVSISTVADIFYRSFPDKALNAIAVAEFALRGQKKDLLNLTFMGTIAALLGMFTPLATGLLIDHAIPDSNRNLLIQIGWGLLFATMGIAVFELAKRKTIVRLQTNIDITSQAAVWDRLLKLQMSFFREYASGDLKNRVLAISQIRTRLSKAILPTLFSSLFALLNLGILFFYSLPLAVMAIVFAIIAFLVTNLIRQFTSPKFRALQAIEGQLFGTMVQMIGGVSKLRVAGAENRAFAYWTKKYSQQLKFVLSTQYWQDILTVFNKLIPTVSLILFFGVAISLLQPSPNSSRTLSTGTFLAFNIAYGAFIGGATNLSNIVIELLEAGILWERTRPILQAQPEVDASKSDPGKLVGNIKLDRVSFRYRLDGSLILDHVTLEAKTGEFIALVGPSGSGKSTILRLLLGFETPASGTLYYDGQDLSGLDISAVRRQLGTVLQNGHIQSASMLENISAGAIATLTEAWEAAKLAGLAEDIEQMPMGMHTHISEGGSNLSGGQRQRLLIARALLAKPKILLLDEATSALDNRTQELVSENLAKLQVTRIAIAHRLSTIRHADRIYVLEAGQIIQQGTFAELAHQPGLFQRLIARQMT
jgi:NHLM bacteriocin system ABC transporter ATP-binding protein